MANKKLLKTCLSIFMLMFLLTLTACGKYRKAEKADAINYIENRYDVKVKSFSASESSPQERKCLDTSAEPYTYPHSTGSHDNTNPDIIYTMETENGVTFHLVQMYRYGIIGCYGLSEDYLIQLLIANPHLYEKLKSSPYHFQYNNTIGAKDIPDIGFSLFVSSFDEIKPATELAHSVIANEAAILPDNGTFPEYLNVDNTTPQICIMSGEIELGRFNFRTTEKPELPDLQKKTQLFEYTYVQNVRDGALTESLSDDILNTYGPEKIEHVTYNGKELPNFNIYYGINHLQDTDWDCYIVWDNDKKNETCDIYYDDLDMFLTTVGYHMSCKRDSITWSNEKNTVTIRMRNSSVTCIHNGNKYVPDGILNSAVLKFSEKDIYELFGIRFDIDRINETAEVIMD